MRNQIGYKRLPRNKISVAREKIKITVLNPLPLAIDGGIFKIVTHGSQFS